MVHSKITRWSPDTCGCVIEMVTDFDDNDSSKIINDPKFLLMNEVCDSHAPLKSMTFKPQHGELSSTVLQVIERAKSENLKQVDAQIAKAQTLTKRKARTLRDLYQCRRQVVQFNSDLDEEWGELVMVPHAFDDHIHAQVVGEQQKKQQQEEEQQQKKG